MTELSILKLFLGVTFLLAPSMTNNFFLNDSKIYSRTHGTSFFILLLGMIFNLRWPSIAWPCFCVFGFFLYIKQEGELIFSTKGLTSCIPFVFSLISSAWFIAGVNNLHLLGYNENWSFYAALHGGVLGWLFIGCLAFLSRRPNASRMYLFGCYSCLFLFLSVAFGINGIPYIKRIGVIGLSALVPISVGLFLFEIKKGNRLSLFFSELSFFSIILAMTIAILNEFWVGIPKVALGIPFMTLTHGFINTILTVPCFYLAIRLASEDDSLHTGDDKHVVFFDGHCVLCNRAVTTLLKIDKHRVLRYSSLQASYAEKILDSRHTEFGESIVFLSHGHFYEKAEAVIHILLVLDGIYKLAAMFLNIFPLFILNKLYEFIAHNRYRLFGKNNTCLVPTNENKNLFIS